MMQRHSVDEFVFHPPRSAKLSAATCTTVNHAARRGHILTQSSARCGVLCSSSEYKTNRVRS